jgi:cytochrome b
MAETRETGTPVWDLPTRIFHWALVLLVGLNLFLIEPRGGILTVVHFLAGYVVLALVLFRLVWGFIGSPRSRFADFVQRWPAVSSYAARLRRLDLPHSIGHNPLGGWMIVLLLAALGVIVLTGLAASGRAAAGPLALYLPVAWTAVLGEVHQLAANLLIALIVVHVAGVAVDWFLTGDNLVAAMWTGRKRLPPEAAAVERPVAPVRRAALVGAATVVIVAGLIAATDFTASRRSLQAQEAGTTAQTAPAPATTD